MRTADCYDIILKIIENNKQVEKNCQNYPGICENRQLASTGLAVFT